MPDLACCPLCDSAERTLYAQDGDLQFHQCGDCGLIYRTTLIGADRAGYDDLEYFSQYGYDRARARRIRKASYQISILEESLEGPATGKRLLDVGCSLGYTLEAAQQRGWVGVGIDVSPLAVRYCQEQGFEARVSALESIDFPDAQFDAVVLKHVLEHTWEPRLSLAELHRVLRPGGVVFFDVPDARYHKGQRRRAGYSWYRRNGVGLYHYVYYTPTTLSRLVTQAGFEVTQINVPLFFWKQIRPRPWLVLRDGLYLPGRLARHLMLPALRLRKEFYLTARKR